MLIICILLLDSTMLEQLLYHNIFHATLTSQENDTDMLTFFEN